MVQPVMTAHDVAQVEPVESHSYADSRFLFVHPQAGVFYTRVLPRSTLPSHVHDGCHQYSFVVRGRGTLDAQLGRIEVSPGVCVCVPAGVAHAWHNPFDEPLEYLELKVPAEGAPDIVQYVRERFPERDDRALAIDTSPERKEWP